MEGEVERFGKMWEHQMGRFILLTQVLKKTNPYTFIKTPSNVCVFVTHGHS